MLKRSYYILLNELARELTQTTFVEGSFTTEALAGKDLTTSLLSEEAFAAHCTPDKVLCYAKLALNEAEREALLAAWKPFQTQNDRIKNQLYLRKNHTVEFLAGYLAKGWQECSLEKAGLRIPPIAQVYILLGREGIRIEEYRVGKPITLDIAVMQQKSAALIEELRSKPLIKKERVILTEPKAFETEAAFYLKVPTQRQGHPAAHSYPLVIQLKDHYIELDLESERVSTHRPEAKQIELNKGRLIFRNAISLETIKAWMAQFSLLTVEQRHQSKHALKEYYAMAKELTKDAPEARQQMDIQYLSRYLLVAHDFTALKHYPQGILTDACALFMQGNAELAQKRALLQHLYLAYQELGMQFAITYLEFLAAEHKIQVARDIYKEGHNRKMHSQWAVLPAKEYLGIFQAHLDQAKLNKQLYVDAGYWLAKATLAGEGEEQQQALVELAKGAKPGKDLKAYARQLLDDETKRLKFALRYIKNSDVLALDSEEREVPKRFALFRIRAKKAPVNAPNFLAFLSNERFEQPISLEEVLTGLQAEILLSQWVVTGQAAKLEYAGFELSVPTHVKTIFQDLQNPDLVPAARLEAAKTQAKAALQRLLPYDRDKTTRYFYETLAQLQFTTDAKEQVYLPSSHLP